MVSVCSVPNCPSQGNECTMHAFPKSPELSRLWVTTISRSDLLEVPAEILRRNRRVCDMHFSKSQRFPKNRKNTDLKAKSVPDMHLNLPKGFLQYSRDQLMAVDKVQDECAQKTPQTAFEIPVEVLSKESVLHTERSLAKISVKTTDLQTAIRSAPWGCTLTDGTSLTDKSSNKCDETIHSSIEQESEQPRDFNAETCNSVHVKQEWNEEDSFVSMENVATTNRNIDSPESSFAENPDGTNVRIKQESDMVFEETRVKVELPSEEDMQNWKALECMTERKKRKWVYYKYMEFLDNCAVPSTPPFRLEARTQTVRVPSRKKLKGATIEELSSTELLCLSVAKEVMKMPDDAQNRFKVDVHKLCIKYYEEKLGSSRK